MPDDDTPALRILGTASPEEVAALVTALAAATRADQPPRPRSTWADPARRLRTLGPSGPGAWRASGLPS